MEDDIKTQAALESAWVKAFYVLEYWKEIANNLNPVTDGNTSKKIADGLAKYADNGGIAVTETEVNENDTILSWH